MGRSGDISVGYHARLDQVPWEFWGFPSSEDQKLSRKLVEAPFGEEMESCLTHERKVRWNCVRSRCRLGQGTARAMRVSHLLLLAHAGKTDEQIHDELQAGLATVERLSKR